MTTSSEERSTQQVSNRTAYRLEAPKALHFKLDISTSKNESLSLNAEQFEYGLIESPQKFHDCYVDWRIFNIVLWSKCYCRYDKDNMPTLREQQLAFEISCLQEDIQNVFGKSRRQTMRDARHPVRIFYY